MALLELCEMSDFDCSRLVVCLDRQADPEDTKGLMRDLGWVGFEVVTLAEWTESDEIVSDRWMFLSMDA
jgi:Ornithine decarboxylase antizyme